MTIIEAEFNNGNPIRVTVETDTDDEQLEVKITDEGIIVDLVAVTLGGEVVGSWAATFEELVGMTRR